MSTILFDKKTNKIEAAIPNKQLEMMFLAIASDDQMREYNKLVDKGLIATASAYASHKVYRTFMYWRDRDIAQGVDLEYLQYKLWKRGN